MAKCGVKYKLEKVEIFIRRCFSYCFFLYLDNLKKNRLKAVEIELFIQFSPHFANTFSVICNYMKRAALIFGIITSTLSFSQNNSEIVDVVVNGKVQSQEEKDAQNYVANYLTNFFEKTYEKENGFYLVSEQKTQNNRRNSLKMDEFPFLYSKDIKKVTLKSNGNKFPTVIFELKKKATEKLSKLTSNNIGNGIALIIDKKIIAMPMISQNISDGKIEYNSMINYEETQKLLKKIKK